MADKPDTSEPPTVSPEVAKQIQTFFNSVFEAQEMAYAYRERHGLPSPIRVPRVRTVATSERLKQK